MGRRGLGWSANARHVLSALWLAGCVRLTPDQPLGPARDGGSDDASVDSSVGAGATATDSPASTDAVSESIPDRSVHDAQEDRSAQEAAPDQGSDALPAPDEEASAIGCILYVGAGSSEANVTFPTISAALRAASAAPDGPCTIHVASGTYSAASGESMPLVLRGVSLVGTDRSSTIIEGAAAVDSGVPLPVFGGLGPPPFATNVSAALVVGDSASLTSISHVTVESSVENASGYEGILCDRGNTLGGGQPANTRLDDVLIEGFETGVRVTYWPGSDQPAAGGCLAQLTRSTLQNGSWGVFADGVVPPDGGPPHQVSVKLGDGTQAGGNALQGFRVTGASLQWDGAGLVTRDGVTGVSAWYNQFSDSDVGIWISQTVADKFDVEYNDFGFIDNVGLWLSGPAIADPLQGNTFHDLTSTGPSQGFPATALLLLCDPTPSFPTVRVRGNSFFGNDTGVQVRTGVGCTLGSMLDFGTSTDPGGNFFRCNRPLADAGVAAGTDFSVYVPNAPSGTVLPCEGNTWDQVPPSSSELSAVGVTVDVANSLSSSAPTCPAGRGP